jgi:hypothetical protein
MAEFKVKLGDVFLISHSEIPHFYVVIAPISKDLFLLVNLTSRKPNLESACILEPSLQLPDFINRESVINYRQAVEISTSGLQKKMRQGLCQFKDTLGEETLFRIQAGGLKSRFLKNQYKEILKQVL